ncbi:MAG: oligosaccharide flippase family protein [Paludibacter sp.]|jgi:O-antigen/teichoic acid export membrane protein|nr:oligosaccharide flippase family protein [Paludibacter sp.]
MSDFSSNSKRIAKNTTLLYIRMLVVMIINLYAVRLVLKALGVEDYGIYNVIAGVITMLYSVSSVLASATQRFYSYSIGENAFDRLKGIFSTSLHIYVVLSFVIILIGETVGLWFVNTQLVIPPDRIIAANWIYQFSIFSFIVTIMQVPYSAAIIAHEDMGVFSLISTSETILKLLSIFLIFIIPIDRLIIYGATLFIISIIVLIAYISISYKRYPECRYQKPTEKKLFIELLTFSGWSFFGSIAGVGMSQVNTIFVNLFFGPIVNTARAISFQFNSAITSFVGSFILAVRTPMIKSYADESYLYLNKIFSISNKFIYYFLLMICIPLVLEMNTVLNLWLTINDNQTVLFSRLMVIYTLIMALNNPIAIVIHATGHVKEYHLTVETIMLLCVPATYILFKLGYPAYSTYTVMIIAASVAHVVRLVCLKRYYKPFSYFEYLKSFIIPAFFITVATIFIAIFVHKNIIDSFIRISSVATVSIVCITVMAYLFGLSKTEKDVVNHIFANMMKKIGLK